MTLFQRLHITCRHDNHTFPQTADGETYVACLDCGKHLTYDFKGLGEVLTPPTLTAPRLVVNIR
jgi:ribosomal protein S27E